MGALYRITFPNGKSYIGITSKTAGQRLAVHSYEARRGTKLPLYHAMRKYGADCIALHTLALADDWQELCGMERAAIAEQHTRSPDGYNATDGGDGAPVGHRYRVGLKHTEASKRKMSETRRASGFRHTDETRARIGAASKGNKHSLGCKHSAETIRRRAIGNMLATPHSASGVKGVSWCKQTRSWRAHITNQRKMRTLGRFKDKDEAIAVRKAAELEVLGAVAC